MAQMPFFLRKLLSKILRFLNLQQENLIQIEMLVISSLYTAVVFYESLLESKEEKKSKQQIYMGNYNVIL